VATVVYEDHGVRVECPSTWEIEVSEDGDEATISLQDPGGLAFGLVTTDDSCPDPDDVAAAALAAMREEYPELDVEPVFDTHGEHAVTGFDVEFFALDSANAARIRCFSTPRRTVLLFGQWSELGDSDLGETVAAVLGSVQELED
jgi:hypothetical protein